MIEVPMPRLSDSMEEGLIVTWLVDQGAEVSQGDDLVEIETDKANMTFEADGSGFVHIVAEEGDSLPVGALIAYLLAPGDAPPAGGGGGPPHDSPTNQDHGQAEGTLSPNGPPSAVADHSGRGRGSSAGTEAGISSDEMTAASAIRVKASPLARRIASERSVRLEVLEGSGPGGRIVKADVQREIAAREVGGSGAGEQDQQSPRGSTRILDTTRLQQTVARRMIESKTTIPHFYLSTTVDIGHCFDARKRIKESALEGAVVPSFNDMIIKASGLSLREFPVLNGAYRDGRLELYSRVNIGVAVAAEDALVVPVIADADRRGLLEIAMSARELAGKVRDGSITPPDVSGGTFTVSNLGMFGVTNFGAVINPGQAAILAVGSIEERPVVRNSELVPGRLIDLTLSCDHRIVYGAEGAQFLARIKSILEEPLNLAM